MRVVTLLFLFAASPALAAPDARDVVIALDLQLRMACGDVVGVSLGRLDDKKTWRIDYEIKDSLCRADAEKVLREFDINSVRPAR